MTKSPSVDLMLDLVLNALPFGLFWKDRDSHILGCNQKFADDSGVAVPADLIGKTNFDFYPPEVAKLYRTDDLEVITTGRPKLGIEEPMLLANGETVQVETNKVPIRNTVGEVVGVLGTYRDLTERRHASYERVRFALELAAARQAVILAMHDSLTGLPNRRYLQEKLRARLLEVRSDKRLAVVALDLDRFKTINDLYGHAAGDELLQKVASLLKEAVGTLDFAARLGGDEFILLLNYDSDVSLARQLSALITKFDAPIALADYEVSVGATLGVALYPTDGTDPDLLTRRADTALYHAKELGRARYTFFELSMELVTQDLALMERELRTAIKADQIVPYFQPLVELSTGKILCYEVLARWLHPQRGLILPGQFIKIAENIGLIGELTNNLLRRACREALNWQGTPRIAMNVSPAQLRDAALSQKVLQVLTETGFPPARLEIEVTEDVMISNFDTAQTILISLKNQGIRIALDDFGVGYSSLQHLRRLPFDILKIDRSFVQSMDDGEDSVTIVKAIVQLAKSLGLSVTAEGIETESQLFALRALGCERGQGFFLGRPCSGAVSNEGNFNLNAESRTKARARVS